MDGLLHQRHGATLAQGGDYRLLLLTHVHGIEQHFLTGEPHLLAVKRDPDCVIPAVLGEPGQLRGPDRERATRLSRSQCRQFNVRVNSKRLVEHLRLSKIFINVNNVNAQGAGRHGRQRG